MRNDDVRARIEVFLMYAADRVRVFEPNSENFCVPEATIWPPNTPRLIFCRRLAVTISGAFRSAERTDKADRTRKTSGSSLSLQADGACVAPVPPKYKSLFPNPNSCAIHLILDSTRRDSHLLRD